MDDNVHEQLHHAETAQTGQNKKKFIVPQPPCGDDGFFFFFFFCFSLVAGAREEE
jgi:hypothetical protein